MPLQARARSKSNLCWRRWAWVHEAALSSDSEDDRRACAPRLPRQTHARTAARQPPEHHTDRRPRGAHRARRTPGHRPRAPGRGLQSPGLRMGTGCTTAPTAMGLCAAGLMHHAVSGSAADLRDVDPAHADETRTRNRGLLSSCSRSRPLRP